MVSPIDQLTSGGRYPHEDCAEACERSILLDDGQDASVAAIEGWHAAHGDSPADGSGGDVVAASLSARGIPARVVSERLAEAVLPGLARGLNRWVWAIYSDRAGRPNRAAGLGHFVLVYGMDAARVYVMQPVGGYLVSYDRDAFDYASQNYGVEVGRRIGAAAPAPVPNASTPGDDMQVTHPTDVHRVDAAYCESSGGVVSHLWTVDGQEVQRLPVGTGRGRRVLLLAWTTDTELTIAVEGVDGNIWRAGLDIAGNVAPVWVQR